MANSNTWCEDHWFASKAKLMDAATAGTDFLAKGRQLKAILERQAYRCPYSGEILVPGQNASKDHKLPKSRYPELATDVENIEWASLRVNKMKHDMTREEFLEMCLRIVEHTGIGKRTG